MTKIVKSTRCRWDCTACPEAYYFQTAPLPSFRKINEKRTLRVRKEVALSSAARYSNLMKIWNQLLIRVRKAVLRLTTTMRSRSSCTIRTCKKVIRTISCSPWERTQYSTFTIFKVWITEIYYYYRSHQVVMKHPKYWRCLCWKTYRLSYSNWKTKRYKKMWKCHQTMHTTSKCCTYA